MLKNLVKWLKPFIGLSWIRQMPVIMTKNMIIRIGRATAIELITLWYLD